jgi:hypoxanthine-DNA glycosylase
VFDQNCTRLILGSFPSVASRENMFFYGHPQNRFWRVLSAVLGCPLPQSIEEKKEMLLENNISLWDVAASCRIEGSSDSSIKDVVPNDLGIILSASPIERIFTNGGTAHRLYKKHCLKQTGIEDICLPSTSPANARFSLDMLVAEWKKIIQ